MHDHIPQVLFLYTLSSAPDSRIIDVLHLCDLYEAKTGHVVVQSLGLSNGKAHLMDDGIDLDVVFDLILGLEVNGSVSRRALFDADSLIGRQILLFDVPQGVTVAGKADSQQLTFTILTSQIVQVGRVGRFATTNSWSLC